MLLWLVAGALLVALWMFGVSDLIRPVHLGGEETGLHRPFARLAFSWLMMAVVFLTAIFLTKSTLED